MIKLASVIGLVHSLGFAQGQLLSIIIIIIARSKLQKVLFLALSVTFFCLFVNRISWERLNGFAPNSVHREDVFGP